MLERVEESADQIIVLKTAVEFYLKHLQDQIAECEQQAKGLPASHKELEALLSQGNRTEIELQALEKQYDLIVKELDPLRPFLNILGKVEELEGKIRDKEKLSKEKQTAITSELQAMSRGGKFVKEEVGSTVGTLEHEKLILDLDVNSLGVDRSYQLRRLKELKVDREVIKGKESDIQSRADKVLATIEQKREVVDTISKSVTQQKEAIGVAQPADVRLRGLKRDYEHLMAVAKIVDGVSLDAEALLEQGAESAST